MGAIIPRRSALRLERDVLVAALRLGMIHSVTFVALGPRREQQIRGNEERQLKKPLTNDAAVGKLLDVQEYLASEYRYWEITLLPLLWFCVGAFASPSSLASGRPWVSSSIHHFHQAGLGKQIQVQSGFG